LIDMGPTTLIFLFAGVLACAAAVQELFVSTLSGDDVNNNGSVRAAPLKTLERAAQLVALGGSVAIVLFDGEHFEACAVSLRAANVSLLSAGGATVGCAQRVDASGLNMTGVFEVFASSAASIENVTFAGFSSFNTSSVAVQARAVELRNVTLFNNTVDAECFERIESDVDHNRRLMFSDKPDEMQLELRSPLRVNASLSLDVLDCTFVNNSLHVAPSFTFDAFPFPPFFELPTLRVPGGGALGVDSPTVAISNSVFESNRVTADALDPQLTQSVVLSSAACGGAVLVVARLAHGMVRIDSSQFIDNGVTADHMCGGAVAIIAAAMVRAGISSSTFVGSSHKGMQSYGMSVALVDWEKWQSVLNVQDTRFRDTVVDEADALVVLQGGAAFAFQLGITNVSVSGFNVTLRLSQTVSGGVFSSSVLDGTDLSISDNSFTLDSHDYGLLIGPLLHGQRLQEDDWCNMVFLEDTTVARNLVTSEGVMHMSLIRTVSSVACAALVAQQQGTIESIELRRVSFVGNVFVADTAIELNGLFGLVELQSPLAYVELSHCEFSQNVWGASLVRLAAASARVEACTFSGNDVSDFQLVQARAAQSFTMDHVRMFDNSRVRGGAMVSAQSITISNATFRMGGEALRIDGAIDDAFSDFGRVAISTCEFEQASLTILPLIGDVSVTNSTFNASAILTITTFDQGPMQFERSFSATRSTFVDCAPVLLVRSLEIGDQTDGGFKALFQNCRFSSTLPATARALFVSEHNLASFLLMQCDFAMASQAIALLKCELLSFDKNCTIWGSSGVTMLSGDLKVSHTLLRGVVGNSLVAAPNASLTLTNVTLVGSGPIVAHAAQRVELVDVIVSDTTLATSAIEVVGAQSLALRNVAVRAVDVAGDGAVTLSQIGALELVNATVDGCVATRGGAFHVGELGDVVCNGSRAINNRARLAGGAVLVDDVASTAPFVACLSLSESSANNSAGAYAPAIAATALHLVVKRRDTPAMPGVGLVGVHVALVDEFGQLQRPLNASTGTALRSGETTVFAELACDSQRETTFACRIGESSVDCTFDLRLPAAGSCAIAFSAPSVRGVQLNVSLSPCAFGFGVESAESAECVACLPDTAAIGGSSKCHACPTGASCCGGERVFARPEHFLAPNGGQLEALQCLPGVCLGSNVSCVSDDLPQINRCAPFRMGVLCAHCNDTRLAPIAPDASGNNACLECDTVNVAIVVLVVAALAAFAIIVHLNTAGSSATLKILLFFTQIAGLEAPGGLLSSFLATTFGFRVSAASGSFGGVCIAPLDHFSLVLVRMTLPFVLLTLLLVVAAASAAVRACRARRRRTTIELEDDVPLAIDGLSQQTPVASVGPLFSRLRLLRTSVAIVLLTFSVAVDAALDVLRCREIGGQLLLASDVRQSCTTDVAVAWRRAAMFGFLPLAGIVIISVCVSLQVLRRANGNRLPAQHPVLGVLFECYRTERTRMWWEAFVLVRRLAIGLISVFGDRQLRHFLFTMINTASLLATVIERPFADPAENWLDVIAQAWLVLLGGVIVNADDATDQYRVLAVALTAMPVVAVVLFMLRARFARLRAWIASKRKRIEK
jgi:hypothetical protein